MKKVSIIVPVYNTEKYLRRCLDSLVNQTLDDIEIIAIDDCSKDGSKEILKEYKSKYKNVKIIYNKTNMYIGYTRNLGIVNATGEYIGFVDSDDWVEKDMYEKMYNKAKKDKLDLVLCNFHTMLEKQDFSLEEIESKTIPYFDNTRLKDYPNLLIDVELAPWNKLYKKTLLDNIRFPLDIKYEDTIFVIKAMARAKKIGIVADKLNYYLVRSKSETAVMDKRVYEFLEITKMMVEELKSHKYYDDIKEYVEAMITRNLFRYTLQQKYQKDKKIANDFINEVFKYLNSEFPNWKNNKVWKKRNFLKRMIEKNKVLTKLYCSITKV